ncbi:MAG TPA: efflux RND transporter permease subunit, partial [Vicinamibacterales bacterium]|nr:efflux RND transporter permease subunit [Vicinamibacterales bacterium]
MSARLAAFLYRFRFPLSAAIVSGAVALLPRVDITTIDNDITAWFSREDPVYREYERFRREFGGTRQLIVALEVRDPAGGDVFTRERLEAVDAISAAIERIPTVERVHSLATATVVSALDDGEGIDVRPLADYLDRGGPARVRALAMGDELVRGDLVSEDGRVAAILVGFDEDRVDAVRAQVLEAVRRAVESRLPPGLVAHYNGSIEISETYNRVTLANQRQFTPPILLVTLAALWAMFRSWRKTLLVLVAIVVSLAWTLGLYSLAGFSYNVLSSMLVPLIVVLAIADDVHIVQHFERERRHAGPREAFEHTVASLAAPIAGASGTTALGMLSLATSDIVAVRTFGIGAAVGVMVDCALSLVLVPTLLTLVPPDARAAPHERRLVEPLRQAARATAARWRIVLVAAAIVTAIAGAGIARLRVETNHISFFADRHPLHVSADLIDRELAGVYGFNIMLEGPPGSLASPDALRRMD